MQENLNQLDGCYRFLIPSEEGLIIGPRADNLMIHKQIAEKLNLDPNSVKGGYVAIWDKGEKMAYVDGAQSVPVATEEDFKTAKEKDISVFGV